MAENKFLYLPTRSLFERTAVIRQLGGLAAKAIEKEKVCSNLYWAPGRPTFMENVAVIDGALFDYPGNNLLNLYRKSKPTEGDPAGAYFWRDLGQFLFGEDFKRLEQCLAFKLQFPHKKINHAILLGSNNQGIGKDSLLAPIKVGIGSHNFGDVTASNAVEWTTRGFTAPILRKVITRISEVHDLGPGRFKFYDMTKDWAAAPPETLLIADKNVKAYSIENVVLPIYSSNHKTDGLFIPPDDRRIDALWSNCVPADFQQDRWRNYWEFFGYDIVPNDLAKDEFWQGWYKHLAKGGAEDVVAYLMQPSVLEGFSPGATPVHSAAWHEIVAANRNPQDAELMDVLDAMGESDEPPDFSKPLGDARPDAVTIPEITRHPRCGKGLAAYFADPKHSRAWAHRLEAAGYVSVRNPDVQDGSWKIGPRRRMIYARSELTPAQAQQAARDLIERESKLTTQRTTQVAQTLQEAFGD
ncbi:MAG: primase-helicase family protein [Xanthobacteraceae bacterium]